MTGISSNRKALHELLFDYFKIAKQAFFGNMSNVRFNDVRHVNSERMLEFGICMALIVIQMSVYQSYRIVLPLFDMLFPALSLFFLSPVPDLRLSRIGNSCAGGSGSKGMLTELPVYFRHTIPKRFSTILPDVPPLVNP